MSVLAILSLLRKYWWAPIILGLGITVAIQRGTIARKDAKLQHLADAAQITLERVNRAQAEAKAKDLENARRVETAQAQATQEVSGEYSANLARAQALASAYARRLRDAQAAGGVSGGSGQPGNAKATSSTAGAGSVPVMDDDDFRVCTENSIKAIGWRTWWAKVSAIPRDTPHEVRMVQ